MYVESDRHWYLIALSSTCCRIFLPFRRLLKLFNSQKRERDFVIRYLVVDPPVFDSNTSAMPHSPIREIARPTASLLRLHLNRQRRTRHTRLTLTTEIHRHPTPIGQRNTPTNLHVGERIQSIKRSNDLLPIQSARTRRAHQYCSAALVRSWADDGKGPGGCGVIGLNVGCVI